MRRQSVPGHLSALGEWPGGEASLCSTRDVYIQPSEGEHCPGTPCYNINTFGEMADSFSNSSGLVFHFLEGTHLLDLQELVVFKKLTNAVFEGNGTMEQGFHETVWQSTVVIKCTNGTGGIGFVNSSNITFKYITITNCGARANAQMLGDNSLCKGASLSFFNVENIIFIDHVSVQNGSGSGLFILTNGADITINQSSFAQNGYGYGLSKSDYCGNFAIFYTDDLHTCSSRNQVRKTFITSTNSSFGSTDNNRLFAGLLIITFQRSYSIDIVLESIVAYKNSALFGSIYIASASSMPTYDLTINNLRISDGNGGLQIISGDNKIIDTFFDDYKTPSCDNTSLNKSGIAVVISNSTFEYISCCFEALFFGFPLAVIAIGFENFLLVRIESTEISYNECAGLGPLFISSLSYQRQVDVSLTNVTISNNIQLIPTILDNNAAVRAEFASLVLNNVRIFNNKMTGLSVYHSNVIVRSNSRSDFHNNSARTDGGGLALYADSYLVFEQNTTLDFIGNNASQRGGAIFIETSNQLTYSPCFFQYNTSLPKSAIAFFDGNTAGIAGSVVFGGRINDCNLFLYNELLSNKAAEYFNKTFNYSTQTGPSVISSEPTDVCFCDENNTRNCSQTQLTMTAYPGEEINISVVAVGQQDGVVPGKIQLIDEDLSHSYLYNTTELCTNITLTSDGNIFYRINTLSSFSFDKILIIEPLSCPLGFQLSNITKLCDCDKQLKDATANQINCNANNKTITRLGDVWIGDINDSVTVYTPCPFDYCNTAQVSFFLTDPDPQCAFNRTGTLCGGCKLNFSHALGSNNCIKCPQSSYLALIIPFAAAGFGLVAVLMVLNLTVSIGTINGLIFYASIVKISESTGIFFPNGPIPVLSQFIAWLNLDLGIETRFYPGMTAYHKVWLQFVFPLYIWFIITTIIVLCHYSTWLSNKIGGNVVQVLATLILLSFTKLFRTFAPALTWVSLPSTNNCTIVKWYVDGNVSFYSPKHYILMAAAVLFLLLAVPYVLALLFDAVIEKYLTKFKCFRNQWIKLKPFADAYHGPYKDNCRFWTGLLLLVRMSFTLVSLRLDTFGTLIFITASTTVLLSLMVIFEGVYQKKYLNILECLSLLNLGLLSALAAVYQNNNNSEQVVTTISVSVAFIAFTCILFYRILLRTNKKCFGKAIKNFWRKKNKESKKLLDVSSKQTVSKPTSSEVFLKRESLIEYSTE